MSKKRVSFLALMSSLACALMLLSAPAARAQVAAQDSVALDPFDPVPEIQFRHLGGNGCWDDCGTRDCDGCVRCHEGCERRCHSNCYVHRRCSDDCWIRDRCVHECYVRHHCDRDCQGWVRCDRGCHPGGGYVDRGRRFDHDADRVEEDHQRFLRDAREFERDDRAWHQHFDDQWDRDGSWLGDGHWGQDGKWQHNGHWADKDHYVRDGYWDRDGRWVDDANADNDGDWGSYERDDRDNQGCAEPRPNLPDSGL